MNQPAILFRTSLASDVQRSGGILSIAGLSDTKISRISSISQVKSKAEVVQVKLVGSSSYTPTANTLYTVLIGDINRVKNGVSETLTPYSYKTPLVLTTIGANAAEQREAIHLEIIAKITSNPNFCTATTLGTGSGFYVTDTAGYYPPFSQTGTGRLGASQVFTAENADGTGFSATDVSTTTEAVYSTGLGANLLASIPVIDAMYGGLLSGYLYSYNGIAPKTIAGLPAVSGQNYDIFVINTLDESAAFGGGGNQKAFIPTTKIVVVDNGTGASTTNLAGFIAFERQMHKLIATVYSTDPSTLVEFFDENFVIQGPLGAVPVTTTSLTNKFLTPYGLLNHVNIGAQTIVSPTQGANGLLIEQDATATDGAQYSAPVSSICDKQIIVGKQAATFLFKFSATTVANIVAIAGLRTKEAFNVDFNAYTNLAGVGTGPAGTDIYSYGILADAATVATNSTLDAVNSVAVDIRIQVSISGAVTCYANGTKIPIYSAGTTPLVFAEGTVLIPFFQYTNLNSAAAVPNVTELLTFPTDLVVI